MKEKDAIGFFALIRQFLHQVQNGKTAPALFTSGTFLLLGAFFSPIRSEIGTQNGATWMVIIGLALLLIGVLQTAFEKAQKPTKKPSPKR